MIDNVHGAMQIARTGQRSADAGDNGPFEPLRVGEQVLLKVMRAVDARTFIVSFGGEQHVVESSMQLPVGGRVRAVVTAVGERLELQYVETTAAPPAQREDERLATERDSAAMPAPTLLSALQTRYHVSLPAEEHAKLEHAVARATDPAAMALGGLFLAKLGVDVNPPALQAMHDVQVQHNVAVAALITHLAPRDISMLVDATSQGDDDGTQELTQVVAESLPQTPSEAMSFDTSDAGSDQPDGRDAQDLAKLFLNLQDGGSVGYRYGTLPVIVSGQLVELDLVVLQQKPRDEATTPVRRLVMSLRTESFGQVRVDARALDNRLVVTVTSESPHSDEELSATRDELNTLLKRLGWNVEGIGYELDSQPPRAARQIIEHVLSAGTVDMVL